MRKSQVKFGESIAIIIIVYIVVVSGFIWYNDINTKAIYKISEEDKKNKAFEKYLFIVNLDLLHVSQRGFVDEEFDLNSLKSLEEYSNTDSGRQYLDKRIGDAVVVVRLYNHEDLSSSFLNITLYNNTPDLKIKTIENFKTLIPVVDETNKKTHLGILEIMIPFT